MGTGTVSGCLVSVQEKPNGDYSIGFGGDQAKLLGRCHELGIPTATDSRSEAFSITAPRNWLGNALHADREALMMMEELGAAASRC